MPGPLEALKLSGDPYGEFWGWRAGRGHPGLPSALHGILTYMALGLLMVGSVEEVNWMPVREIRREEGEGGGSDA